MSIPRVEFDALQHELDPSIVVLEAGAGTGKTWSLTALVLRLLIEKEIPLDRILLVTFTNKATDELAGRLRERLILAGRYLAKGYPIDSPDDDIDKDGFIAPYFSSRTNQRAKDRRLIERAITIIDTAAISTIHGYCSRILTRNHALCGLPPDCTIAEDDLTPRIEACRRAWRRVITDADPLVVEALLEQTDDTKTKKAHGPALSYDGDTGILDIFGKWLSANRPFLPVEDDPEDLAANWPQLTDDDQLAQAQHIWQTAVDAWLMQGDPDAVANPARLRNACRRLLLLTADKIVIESALQTRRLISDALPRLLHRALHGANKDQLIAALRQQHQAVLVDEFQDTDPLQVAIFSAAYGNQTILRCVGDPKQSIYRFRGADLHAYHSMVKRASRVETMVRNFRSSAACIEAVNACFRRPHVFLNEHIGFTESKAHRKASKLEDPSSDHSLIWWWSEADNKPDAEQLIDDAVAGEIRRLCREAKLNDKLVKPSDCAVMVSANYQAARLAKRLRSAGIPAIFRSQNNVLESAAADEVECLLAALANPSDRKGVRAACATRLWGRPVSAFTGDGSQLAADIDLLARLRKNWDRGGLIGTMGLLMRQRETRRRLFADGDGERHLTDLHHCTELLQSSDGHPQNALDQLRLLRQAGSREATQRLEDDGDAVTILTVHTAKGLQWPIVFAPYLWAGKGSSITSKGEVSSSRPLAYHSSNGLHHDWRRDISQEFALAHDHGIRAEAVRTVYVALTRAEERSYVTFGPMGDKKALTSSGLAVIAGEPLEGASPEASERQRLATADSLWIDETAGDLVANLAANGPCTAKAIAGELGCSDSVARNKAKALCDTYVRLGPKQGRSQTFEATGTPYPAAPDASSFAAHLGSQEQFRVTEPPAGPGREVTESRSELQAAPLNGRIPNASRITSFSGLTRGLPHAHLKGALGDEGSESEQSTPATLTTAGIHSFPAGAGPGDCLHQIIEHTPLDRLDDPTTMSMVRARLVAGSLGTQVKTLDERTDTVLEMLRLLAASRIPGTQTTLGKVPAKAMRHEWEFDLHCGDDGQASMKQVIKAFQAHPDDILDATWPGLISEIAMGPKHRLDGWLNGKVDLVAEIDGKWWIIDWKSNRLGDDATAYSKLAMRRNALESRYPLQWTIYLVALHRLLSDRLTHYDPEVHLGGVAYCYLRGLGGPDGANPESGWLVHRPNSAALAAWSTALSRHTEVLA